jgi:hypothetical protein
VGGEGSWPVACDPKPQNVDGKVIVVAAHHPT